MVVTQPDRRAGRGRSLQEPPVKTLAESLGLTVYQPSSLRTVEQRQPLADVQPDLIVVAAYGLILGRSTLELPVRGCVNLHASLLPRYRGASPISAAILNGDDATGVTLMLMERGLDTGPMFDMAQIPVDLKDTTESMTGRLANIAGDLLTSNLDGLLDGSLQPIEQPDGASLTRPLVKGDGWIDWSRPAEAVERLVRAMWSWPRAWTALPNGTAFQIHEATVDSDPAVASPGSVKVDRSGLSIRCGNGWLRVERGQLAGGKPLAGQQLAGNQVFAGHMILGEGEPPPTPGPMIVSVGE